MKKLRGSLVVILASASMAVAGSDDITTVIPTNVFYNTVSESSSALRAVRIGVANALPEIVLNVGNDKAPVRLGMNTAGALTYNGTALTTETFTGTDITVSQDLSVGRDSAITRNETVGGTLGVTGAASAATMNTGQGAYELYKMDQNVDTAASPTFVGMSLSGAVSGATSVTATKLVASGAGSVGLYSRTKAQILALTPAAAGQAYYCNDCTAVTICVSTGTGAGAFTKVTDRAAACD